MNTNLSLYDAIKDTNARIPQNNALLFMDKFITYEALIKRINQVSESLLKLKITSKDVVTMAMPNIFEAIYAFYAVNKIGAICHMVHPFTPPNQMRRFMEKTGSKTLIVVDTFYDHYKELLADSSITMILANPTSEFGMIKKIGYKLINAKKLKGIVYSDKVLSFNALLKESSITRNDEIDPKRTAVYLHSGGTLGEPKTIELSSFAINSLAAKTSFILGESQFSNKYMLAVLPMFHGFGLCMGVHAMLCNGGINTLMPKFDALQAIKLLKKNQINYVIGVPSLFENLLSKPEIRGTHLQNLHQAFVGGDYVALDLKNRFDRLMKEFGSKARLLEGYGLTEVVTVCSVNTLKEHVQTSVGKPLPGIDMKIVDVETRAILETNVPGEIIVAGDTMMNGYLEDDETNASTFLIDDKSKKWILTGDFGFLDSEGYVHFKQRLKRIIKVSGIPVLPAEIENLLMNFKEIKEVAAVGVPDIEKGFMIKLFVVTDNSVSTAILNEKIHKAIKSELSMYAIPKEIVYLDSLPKTIIGKIDTRKLETM